MVEKPSYGKRGRPKTGVQKYNICVTPEQKALLERIGCGCTSAGVRVCISAYMEIHTPPAKL